MEYLYNYNGFNISKKGDMYCLSDLINHMKEIRSNNLNSMIRPREFLTQKRIINYLSLKLNTSFTRNINKELKINGFYKVTGARQTKRIWVNEVLFDLFFDSWFNQNNTLNVLKYENDFYEILESVFKDILTIMPQFKVDIYRIDFYIKELNLCVEFDEYYHSNISQKNKDEYRELIIKQKLNCDFVRVDHLDFLSGINSIIKIYNKKYAVNQLN